MKRIIAFILIAVSCAAFAEVYVNQTNSNTEYTDTPNQNSQPLTTLPSVNSITSTNAPASSTTPSSASNYIPGNNTISAGSTNTNDATTNSSAVMGAPAEIKYTTFEITSPKPEENIQNQPVLSVSFNVVPNIGATDKIQVMIDNQPVGTPSGTLYQEISNIDRGAHSIYAVLINSQNQILKRTPAFTIYIHRNSTITSPATAPRSFNGTQKSLPTQPESAEIAIR